MKNYVILVCISAICHCAMAQSKATVETAPVTTDSIRTQAMTTKATFLKLQYEHGGLLPVDDNPIVNDMLKNSNFSSLSLSIGWELSPSSVYNSLYRRPVLGLGLLTTNFDNSKIGSPLSVFGFVEIPFTASKSRWTFSYGIAAGLAFHFNPYDSVHNPGNLAIGSRYNAYLHFNVEGKYAISKNWQIGAGIGYKHFSNGSTKKPNAGINLAPINIMVQYKIREAKVPEAEGKLPAFKPFYALSLYNSSGMKQMTTGGELVYKNVTGAFGSFQFSYKYKIGVGAELTYASGGVHRVPGNESDFSKNFSYACYLGWEWYITERLYMPINLGFYLHRNPENSETEQVYQRIGLRYLLLNRHMFAGLGLKAHLGTADFVECTLGWTFHHDRNSYRKG